MTESDPLASMVEEMRAQARRESIGEDVDDINELCELAVAWATRLSAIRELQGR